MQQDARAWIGRVEEREGRIAPELAGMLDGALGHAAAAGLALESGCEAPPLWHWIAFPEFVPIDEIGPDGHPRLGRFLPPIDLGRRMWAGGRLGFNGRFRIGEALSRRSEILSVDEKTGAAGRMVFVRVGHDIRADSGASVREEQDIVYLSMPETFVPPKPIAAPDDRAFDEVVEMDVVRLFRFSAATYNAHRIHYDQAYARDTEKYPALVVHGPMQAMLLLEAASRHVARSPSMFRFRGVHPMFHDHDLHLIGSRGEGGEVTELCTAAPAGFQGLQASVAWAQP